jgi:hypothetical protein
MPNFYKNSFHSFLTTSKDRIRIRVRIQTSYPDPDKNYPDLPCCLKHDHSDCRMVSLFRVTNVELGKHNSFECQVSPDNDNKHSELRAKAHINVLGKCTLNSNVKSVPAMITSTLSYVPRHISTC